MAFRLNAFTADLSHSIIPAYPTLNIVTKRSHNQYFGAILGFVLELFYISRQYGQCKQEFQLFRISMSVRVPATNTRKDRYPLCG